VPFLTSLLSSIIVPIIDKKFNELLGFLKEQNSRLDIYKKADEEAIALIDQIAKANTSEERWAYVHKLKERRAGLGL